MFICRFQVQTDAQSLITPRVARGTGPHLVEAVPCDDPAVLAGSWFKLEECIPEEDMDCGEGTQTPQVAASTAKVLNTAGFCTCQVYTVINYFSNFNSYKL